MASGQRDVVTWYATVNRCSSIRGRSVSTRCPFVAVSAQQVFDDFSGCVGWQIGEELD